jgi:crotonobetaine/carnitine-CoA ligase
MATAELDASLPMAEELTVPGLLRHWTLKTPDNRFCALDGDVFTFAQIHDKTDRLAAGFAALGIGRGDRVAILAPNRVEVLELFFALAKLGAIQVPLNAYLKGDFLKHQIAHSASVALVADAAGLQAVRPMLQHLDHLRHVIQLAGGDGLDRIATTQYGDLELMGQPPALTLNPADTMSIMFTSGTTGLAKGCVLSHGYYVRAGTVTADAFGLGPEDSLFSCLPLFHGGARLLVLTAALTRGIPVTIDSAFSARRFLPRAREVRATVVAGVGAMGQAILAVPPGDHDRDHRIHTMLVAPMPPATQAAFQQRFGIDPWTEFYGQTECVPLSCTPRKGERDRAGCGQPAPDLEVALLDDSGRGVPDGEVGEICIRPREPFAMFDGYWRDPDRTLDAYRKLWYHTGDTARRRPSGELEFVDRKSDSMRRRGENVSSMELESSISAHPAVAEVAVHAVPSAQTEDDIKAWIVLTPGEQVSPDELFEYLRMTLPYFAIPRYIEIVDALPKNAVGRVMKHILRERANSADTIDFDHLGFSVAPAQRRNR